MNNLIPDNFKINGDLIIRVDEQSFQNSVVTIAMVVVIVVIISLLAQRFIKQV